MEYLSRGDAPFSDELWEKIDTAVTEAAKGTLIGRRFIPLYGPLGGGVSFARIDAPGREEVFEDGFSTMSNREMIQVPQLYEDFWLYWRDLESYARDSLPVEVGAAATSAQKLAMREDSMIFYGVPRLGIDGILTAKGAGSIKRSDWAAGEGAFTDVANGIAMLLEKGRVGRHTLVVSQDLFVQLQRIQGGTGVLESERIGKLLDGRIYTSPVLKPKTAFMVAAQGYYMDLLVGQDISTAYTEAVDLNHHLRVLETALVRIKCPDAIVVFK